MLVGDVDIGDIAAGELVARGQYLGAVPAQLAVGAGDEDLHGQGVVRRVLVSLSMSIRYWPYWFFIMEAASRSTWSLSM